MACFAARGGHGANLEPERTALAADFSAGNPDLSDRRRAWGGFSGPPRLLGIAPNSRRPGPGSRPA